MRNLRWATIAAAVLVTPLTANAGFVLEGSLGTGYQVSEPRARVPTNVMIAPGFGLGEMLRLELGFNFSLGDVENRQFDLQLRPMLVLDPPLLPFYARAVAAFSNLVADGDMNYAIGGAAGLSFSLAGLGVFAEVGVIPFLKETTLWTVEGRVGIFFAM
jgi:hypothetical protein